MKSMENHGPAGKALALGTWRNLNWTEAVRDYGIDVDFWINIGYV